MTPALAVALAATTLLLAALVAVCLATAWRWRPHPADGQAIQTAPHLTPRPSHDITPYVRPWLTDTQPLPPSLVAQTIGEVEAFLKEQAK
jgi:hypothetical protein